jgi:hypothetical protein
MTLARDLADSATKANYLDNVTADIQTSITANTTLANTKSKVIFHSVDVTTTSSQSLTAGTPAEITGLTLTITPQSASSKFLLMAAWNGESSSVYSFESVFGFKRDSFYIGNPSADGVRPIGRGVMAQGYYAAESTGTMDSWTGHCLDSPNTTSAITYKVFITAKDAQTLYNNRTAGDTNETGRERTTSSLIVIEQV